MFRGPLELCINASITFKKRLTGFLVFSWNSAGIEELCDIELQ